METNIYASGEYLKANPGWHTEISPWKVDNILRMMAKHGLRPGTVCEVGCGAGEILRLLQQNLGNDCELWGYDIAPQAIALSQARANERLHFHLADFQQEPARHFDMVLVIDVMHHIEDYFSYFRTIHPRGDHFLFQLPLNIALPTVLSGKLVQNRKLYGQLHAFDKETALQAIRDMGYEVLDYLYTSDQIAIFPRNGLRAGLHRHPGRWPGICKRALMKMARSLLFRINQDLAARLLGGWRLLILAK